MAINITVAELLSALRMGASTEETAEATRLLGYATQTISDYLGTAYEGTASEITNEAAVRLAGYLFDQPYASRGTSFAASAGQQWGGVYPVALPRSPGRECCRGGKPGRGVRVRWQSSYRSEHHRQRSDRRVRGRDDCGRSSTGGGLPRQPCCKSVPGGDRPDRHSC